MSSNVAQTFPNHPPDKNPKAVEKDVRKWVESICEYKANLDMEQCDGMAPKKAAKKIRKIKTKKKLSVRSVRIEENKATKTEQKTTKRKTLKKKESSKEKRVNEIHAPPSMSLFDNLKDHYKRMKLPPNWVSGQSRGRLVFCRVRVVLHGSQYEMISDRGVAITSDCLVHVFIDGPEVALTEWKMQKVESIDDLRKAIKAVDALKVCSGVLPSCVKSPSCSIFISGDAKTCQACKSDISNLKVSGMKVARANAKIASKANGSFQN